MEATDSIVDALYAGVADPAAWRVGLERLRRATNCGHVITLATSAGSADLPLLDAVGVGSDELVRFGAAATMDPMSRLAMLPAGLAVNYQSVMPRRAFLRTAFYADVIRPMHGFWGMLAVPFRGGDTQGFVSVCRERRAGELRAADAAAFERVLPSLARAFGARLAVEAAERRATATLALLAQSGHAIAIVDAQSRVLVLTGAMRERLAHGDGFALSRSTLVARHAGDQRRLVRLIAAASRDDPRAPARRRTAILRPGGAAPWSVSVSRLPATEKSPAAGALVAVRIEDCAATPEQLAAALESALGLTPRQAALVAQLALGADLAQAARALGIGLGTARNYLKSAFERTGTHRQAELVARALRVTLAV